MKDNTNALDLVLVVLCLGLIISASLSFLICKMKIPKYSVYFTELSVPDELMYTKYTKMLWELKCILEIFFR